MNVDVDRCRRHLQMEEADGEAARQQQSAVRFAEGVLQRTVADEPAVQEKILHPVVWPAMGWVGDVARELNAIVIALNVDQAVGQFLSTNAAIRCRESPGGRS